MAEATATDENSADTASQEEGAVEVHEAELPAPDGQAAGGPAGQIDQILLDVSVPISASLGTTEMTMGDLLQVGKGSILPLDKEAGEPVDLYLRGTRFATGTVVVVGDKLGVRIKEILSGGGRDGGDSGEGASEEVPT